MTLIVLSALVILRLRFKDIGLPLRLSPHRFKNWLMPLQVRLPICPAYVADIPFMRSLSHWVITDSNHPMALELSFIGAGNLPAAMSA